MSDFEPYDPVVDPFSPVRELGDTVSGWLGDDSPKAYAALSELVSRAERVTGLEEALTQIANPRKQGDPSPPEIARCALGWPAHNVEQSPEAALDEIAALIKDRPMRFQADWVMRDWYAKIDAWWVAQYAIDHPGGLG